MTNSKRCVLHGWEGVRGVKGGVGSQLCLQFMNNKLFL